MRNLCVGEIGGCGMKIPCGRNEDDKYLCCKRIHKWYNTYWIIKRLEHPDVALPNGEKGRLVLERKCLFCGHRVQLGGHPFQKDGWL